MSENLVFYSETRCIMETVIRVAVDVIGNSKVENDAEEQTMNRKVSQRLVFFLSSGLLSMQTRYVKNARDAVLG